MGDSSYMASDLQSIHDIQKPNTVIENRAGQNGINIDEHSASSIEKEDLLELPSREEMEEGETHSGSFKPQIESEAAQTDICSLDENGSISLSSHEAREEDSNMAKVKDCSLLPVNSQEGMQKVTMEETGAQTPANMLHEGTAENEGHPRSLDSLNVVLRGGTMEDGNAVSDNASNGNIISGDREVVPSKFLNDSEKAEETFVEKKDGVGKEIETLDESNTGSSTPPCVSTESSSENNMQPPRLHSANESRQHENGDRNELGGDLEAASLTSDIIQSEVNLSKGEWSDQVTTLISTNLEGWQRFDTEEVNTIVDHTQGSNQRLELWEKLLDDGFDCNEREIQNPPLQLATIPSPFGENQFGLASPGNPFIEGLERVSSFSEADGFARNSDLPSSGRLSQSFEEPSSFRWREGPFHNVSGNDDISSVLATKDGETNTVQLESINEHGQLESINDHESKLDLQFPSSSNPLSSFDAMEPFEAPSFMSLVDPKSHALFEASMPTFQASSTHYGQGNGGEKWVASFDLMAPSTQEITRSSSMPRSGTDASGHRPGQSFSFGTGREQEPSKKESDLPHAHQTKSGFLSPKFSPIVQKVVDKVRTTPAVANGMLHSVRQVMSPTTSDKKSTSKSLLTRCMCW